MAVRRAKIFNIDSIPFYDVPWGRTKSLIGPDLVNTDRYNDRIMVRITELPAGENGAHKMHNHPDQDEIPYVLEGHGENEAEKPAVPRAQQAYPSS